MSRIIIEQICQEKLRRLIRQELKGEFAETTRYIPIQSLIDKNQLEAKNPELTTEEIKNVINVVIRQSLRAKVMLSIVEKNNGNSKKTLVIKARVSLVGK